MSAWVFLLLGGMDSIVFGPIRWCVWSFRPSSPLRLPHLKFLFVCLFECLCGGAGGGGGEIGYTGDVLCSQKFAGDRGQDNHRTDFKTQDPACYLFPKVARWGALSPPFGIRGI